MSKRRGPVPQRKYDLLPLVAKCGTARNLAELAGVHRCSIAVAMARGVTAITADRYAVAAGYHPTEIWTNWLDEDDES